MRCGFCLHNRNWVHKFSPISFFEQFCPSPYGLRKTQVLSARKVLLCAGVGMALLWWAAGYSRAATISVCATGGDYATIGAAIQTAAAGDTLTICAGTYAENLVINQRLTLEGDELGEVIVDGQAQGRVITVGTEAVVTIRNLTVTNGLTLDDDGGGIRNAGVLTLEMSTVRNNVARASIAAGQFGGGIYNSGVLTLINTIVLANQTEESPSSPNGASRGGGIFNSGSAQIVDSVVRGNRTSGQGGGIYSSGFLEIETSEVNDNGTETALGGGIFSSGLLEMSDSIVHNNLAFSEGGLSLTGPALIERSSIYNHNVPVASALGIAANGESITILNSTISGNQSNHPVLQGAVVIQSGQATMINSTLANNEGGNLYGPAALSNTILVEDEAGVNCTGVAPESLGHNLESGNSCGLTQPTDLQNANAALLPLEQNAIGFTPVHELGLESQAIDAGDCNGGSVTVDQREIVRPQGPACDIGAYEKAAPSPAPATPTPEPTTTGEEETPTTTPSPTSPSNTELVRGRVWNDLDGNQLFTANEPGIANVQLNLVDAASGALVQSTRSDGDGNYRFNVPHAETRPLLVGVAPATLPPGLVQSFDEDGALDNKVRLARDDSGQYEAVNFGYTDPILPSGQIGGSVWLDANRNGLREADEEGLPNVQVNLVRPADGSFLASTRTDTAGGYLFQQLAPRDYMVGVARSSLPPGLAPTFDNDDVLDNKYTLPLAEAEEVTNVRFGYISAQGISSAELTAANAAASSIELTFLPLLVR